MRFASALVPCLALIATDRSVAVADETSTGDKLRILYSNRFTFTDAGVPRSRSRS